ncbi:DUF748 domain-containing protein [Nitratidesulfovibrio sp. HK-II]|uniref:DUF748 domain-containing protein n=1 Tax=Nitratidesulfovibrio sp. HK-II TaxID=2009266 RepID=UPI001E4FD564|nr:DUF748 domain-containing protein [Nitratidesulfovibrio sp. HK-II]
MDTKPGKSASGWSPAAIASRGKGWWALRRVRRWTYSIVGIVAAWGVLAGLAMPPLMRGVLEDQLSDKLRVRCTVERVRFNPYSWALSIQGVRVPNPTGDGDLLTFDALEFSPGLSAALRLAPVLAYVRLVNPVVYVAHFGDGRYSFSEFIPPDGEGEDGKKDRADDAKKPLFPFAASDFEVVNGTVIFHDAPLKTIHTITELQFVVPFTSTMERDRERAITPSLNATVDGRALTVQGRLLPFAEHLRTEFDVATDEVDLTQYREYLAAFTPLRLESGRLGVNLKLVVEQPAAHDVEFGLAGSVTLHDLRVNAPDGKDAVLGLTSGMVEVEEFSLLDRHVDVRRVDLDGLLARAGRLADGSIDWLGFVAPAGAKKQAEVKPGGQSPTLAGTATAGGAAANATAGAPGGSAGGAASVGTAAPAVSAPPAAAQAKSEPPFVVNVRTLDMRNATVVWKDASVPGGAQVRLNDLAVTLTDFATPGGKAAPRGGGAFTASLRMDDGTGKAGALGKSGEAPKNGAGTLKAEGTLTLQPLGVALRLDARDLPLVPVRGYVAQAVPALSLDAGAAGAQGEMELSPATPDAPGFVLRKGAAQVSGLSLSLAGQKQPSVGLGRLEVAETSVDLAARTVAVGPVMLTKPDVRVVRGKDGAIDLAALAGGPATAQPAKAEAAGRDMGRQRPAARGASRAAPQKAAATPEAPEWKFSVASLRMDEGRVTFEDRQPKDASVLTLEGMRLVTGPLSPQRGASLDVDFSARWQKQGTIGVKAKGTAQPLHMTVDSKLAKVDLRPLDPYLGEVTDLLFGGGEVSSELKVALREQAEPADKANRAGRARAASASAGQAAEPALEVNVEGAARLDNLSLKLAGGKQELASLRRFSVRGLRFGQQPSGDLSLRVQEVGLEKPKLSVMVFKDGSTSISRALGAKPPAAEGKDGKPPAAAEKDAKAPAATKDAEALADAPTQPANKAASGPATDSASSPATSTPSASSGPSGASAQSDGAGAAARPNAGPFTTLEVGSLSISGGSLRFRDERMSPAFASEMSDIEGRISGVSLDPASRAEVQLRAGIEGVPVLVGGTVNPLIHPVFADMRFTMSGLDLVPLSPYAVQYIAYPVEHGRFSADVAVKAENWVLDADNHFTLSQIELGSKDNRPDAPSYPVKLGLALLQDMSGNVDLRLPVKGRLDDPEFRLGGVIMQAVLNLMVKVVTSPFALVGSVLSLGSGGKDMRYVEFPPGVATLNEAAEKDLRAVVEVLRQRPRLKLEVQGAAEPVGDTRGLKEQALLRALREAKHASLSRAERARVNADDVAIDKDEYEDLLEEVYRDAPFEKPRNVVGFTKSQPADVMEAALKEHYEVTPEALKELATARAKAVRDKLLEIDPALGERVFLAGAKVAPAAGAEGGDGAKGGGSRVNLGLQ